MAVQKIEEFQQKNGIYILKVICKPTSKFPNGFFYAPAEAFDLVQKYTWCLNQQGNGVYVIANTGSDYFRKTICFHKELFKFYQGYDWEDEIDHINMIEFDNTDNNLNAVLHLQNHYNHFTKGYNYDNNWGTFRPCVKINSRSYRPFSVISREDETCIKQNYLEQVILREKLQDQYYMFNFFKYRRGSEDLLDLERIGVLSEEEATYRHILRYADNAWYMFRYGLEDYYKQNHIPIPQYSLDTNGFMVHPITNQRLCPF